MYAADVYMQAQQRTANLIMHGIEVDPTDPDTAFSLIREHQAFFRPGQHPLLDRVVARNADGSYPPKPPGHTRFVCLSDTHNIHHGTNIPDGDILLHSGDFSMTGKPPEVAAFNAFLARLPHRYKVVIAGNHDLTFDRGQYERTLGRAFHREIFVPADVRALLKDCVYLEDQSVMLNGFHIYGSPWQPWFHDWGFNLARGKPCRDRWELIPTGVDILLTHGPPLGRNDRCSDGKLAGCVDLLDIVQNRVRPKMHVFGHIHEAYGFGTDGTTLFVNPCTCNLRYDRFCPQPPIVVDLPTPADAITSPLPHPTAATTPFGPSHAAPRD